MSDTPNERLFSACELGELSQAKKAVSDGADINCQDSNGWSPIIITISNHHSEVTDWLLSLESIDVNLAKDKYGNTTLHSACEFSQSETVTKVAIKTNDVNVLNGSGYSPIQWAVKNDNVEAVLGLRPILTVDWQVKNYWMSLQDMAR